MFFRSSSNKRYSKEQQQRHNPLWQCQKQMEIGTAREYKERKKKGRGWRVRPVGGPPRKKTAQDKGQWPYDQTLKGNDGSPDRDAPG